MRWLRLALGRTILWFTEEAMYERIVERDRKRASLIAAMDGGQNVPARSECHPGLSRSPGPSVPSPEGG